MVSVNTLTMSLSVLTLACATENMGTKRVRLETTMALLKWQQ